MFQSAIDILFPVIVRDGRAADLVICVKADTTWLAQHALLLAIKFNQMNDFGFERIIFELLKIGYFV